MFALVNVTSAESSPPSPPSTPPAGYLQTDHFTGYMNHTTLSAARVHAAAVTEAGQSNQPALSLNPSSRVHARRLSVSYPSSPPPPSPPLSPTTTFDFSDPAGWAASGFTRNSGSTPSTGTGPSNGVDGSGSFYYYVEASYGNLGDLSTLAYDGSACAALGLAVKSVSFHYHMYGSDMGTLRLVDAAGQEAWSMSGDQGNAWKEASVSQIFSSSVAFEYTRGYSFAGDAAVGQVPAAVLRATRRSGISVV